MAFCGNCGTKMEDGVKFCPSCGAPSGAQAEAQPGQQTQQAYSAKLQELNNTADTTEQFDAQDIQGNRVMAILSYLGFLVLIPMLAAKDSPYARYHANQGLVLFVAEVVYSIAFRIVRGILRAIHLGFLAGILRIVGIVFLVLAVIGIVNAVNGRAKELPVIGGIRFLK